jgi:signal transduction histidine kinase
MPPAAKSPAANSPDRRAPAARAMAAAVAALAAAPVHAAGTEGAGPWIFGAVALVLVAVLAWLAGRASAARTGAAPGSAVVAMSAPEGAGAPATAATTAATTPGSALATTPPTSPSRGDQGMGAPVSAAAAAAGLVAATLPPVAGPPVADDVSQFTFTVSHDLRAPLRVAEGFARILKEDYGRQLDRIGNDHLDRVLSATARMNSMIDAMLSLARLSAQPLQRQPVNLSQLAGFIVEDLRRTSPPREVEVVIEPALLAMGDPTLLRQVLENLLSNAWKYSARAEHPRIDFVRSERAGVPAFEVRDNGVGFDMRSAERLFGLFQRLHSANDFPGTGVGLASVQRIVQRHGGQIWAESAPGQGARFFFTLPA